MSPPESLSAGLLFSGVFGLRAGASSTSLGGVGERGEGDLEGDRLLLRESLHAGLLDRERDCSLEGDGDLDRLSHREPERERDLERDRGDLDRSGERERERDGEREGCSPGDADRDLLPLGLGERDDHGEKSPDSLSDSFTE